MLEYTRSHFERTHLMKMSHELYDGKSYGKNNAAAISERRRVVEQAEITYAAAIYFLAPEVLTRHNAKFVSIGHGVLNNDTIVSLINSLDFIPDCNNFVVVYDHHQWPIWDGHGNRVTVKPPLPFLLYAFSSIADCRII